MEFRIENQRTLRSCDLCIICADPREAMALRDAFHINLGTKIGGRDVADVHDGHNFYLGTFNIPRTSSQSEDDKNQPPTLSYYVTSTLAQGIQTFATQAAALFAVLKPRLAIHVGVCAAIPDLGFNIEDVVFGETALNYEEGMWEIRDGKPIFYPEVHVQQAIGRNMEGFIHQSDQPKYKYGDFISGCAVRKDAAQIFDRVRYNQLRNVAALDMEASAFLQACTYTGVEALGIIKGISDMGDSRKGEGGNMHYDRALENAAVATKEFIKVELKNLAKKTADNSNEPGTLAAISYLNNFVKRIISTLEPDWTVENENGTLKLEGLKIVMPESNKPSQYTDFQAIGKAIRECYLGNIAIKGGTRMMPLYTKGPYLIDFPSAMNGLTVQPNPVLQATFFEAKIKESLAPYGRFVDVITWDAFLSLCQELGHLEVAANNQIEPKSSTDMEGCQPPRAD